MPGACSTVTSSARVGGYQHCAALWFAFSTTPSRLPRLPRPQPARHIPPRTARPVAEHDPPSAPVDDHSKACCAAPQTGLGITVLLAGNGYRPTPRVKSESGGRVAPGRLNQSSPSLRPRATVRLAAAARTSGRTTWRITVRLRGHNPVSAGAGSAAINRSELPVAPRRAPCGRPGSPTGSRRC